MPRAPWRQRRITDSPRPAGRRRWTGRLRRSGVFARRVLRVRRRRPGGVDQYPGHPALDQSFSMPGVPVAATASGSASLLPGSHSVGRQLQFLVVNGFTVASLSLGVLAILLAMRGDVRGAAASLLACVVLDGLDGSLARRFRVSTPFGAQMDSLADMCAFGIAAPVVVYAWVVGAVPTVVAAAACALVAVCAAIRLARFNVCAKDSRFFTGVPTTMAAAMLALAVLLEVPLPATVLLAGVAVLAVAMVSGFPYPTLARVLRLPPWLWLVPLAGVLIDLRLTFAALVAGYLASGPMLWLHGRRTA